MLKWSTKINSHIIIFSYFAFSTFVFLMSSGRETSVA